MLPGSSIADLYLRVALQWLDHPTEVALIGVFYVLILGLLYRVLTWEEIKAAAINTAVISGAVTLMFYFTETTSKILILEGCDR